MAKHQLAIEILEREFEKEDIFLSKVAELDLRESIRVLREDENHEYDSIRQPFSVEGKAL